MDRGEVLLRFSHPTRDLQFLSEVLGLTPSTTWLVGEPWHAPFGPPTAIINKDSYWSAGLRFEHHDGFGAQLNRAVELLRQAEATVRDHIASGGKVDIYLYLTGRVNNGDEIPPSLLALMAELGITLGIEVFPN